MKIFCIACNQDVDARLTDGKEIYPHRLDLYDIPFWRCDTCQNYVGCHHKSNNRTKPLGCIATPEIFQMRQLIHTLIDPLWKDGKMTRKKIYLRLSDVLGRPYHSGDLRSVREADIIVNAAKKLVSSFQSP